MIGHRTGGALIASPLMGVAVMLSGCAPSDQIKPVRSLPASQAAVEDLAVPAVVIPEPSSIEEWARDKVRLRHAALTELLETEPQAPDIELARAYGSLGLVLMAAKQYDSAAASFLNATTLAPGDMRWPYYLGQRYLMTQNRAEAAEWFERVLELEPSDEATLVWLGRVHFDRARFDEADRLFSHATLVAPQSAAAWAGAGRAALAKRHYSKAAAALDRALELDPGGTRLHYPLAMAFRSLGDLETAAAHLERFNAHRFERQRGGRMPLMTDPLMVEYYNELESATVFAQRGNQALDDGDHSAAITFFRRGVELEPDNPSIRQRLAAALVMSGDGRGAAEQLEEAVRLAPGFALAHVGLAALLAAEGRHQDAIDRYSVALEYDPEHIEARLGLAESLRASGRLDESLPNYARVAEVEPGFIEAWIGGAEALIRLERFSEAREWLSAGQSMHPNQPQLQQLDEALTARAGF